MSSLPWKMIIEIRDNGFNSKVMFYFLSKTIGIISEPLLHPFLILFTGLMCSLFFGRRFFTISCYFALVVACSYIFLPFGSIALRQLENATPLATDNQISDARAIIILGGFTNNSLVAQERNQISVGSSAERIIIGLAKHKAWPDKKLIISGYSGKLNKTGWSEAFISKMIITSLQHPLDNVFFEYESRNTYQNAVNISKMPNLDISDPMILITSASHMFRTKKIFEKLGFSNLSFYSVDYQTPFTQEKWLFSPEENISYLRVVFHEWLGLLAYKLSGRI